MPIHQIEISETEDWYEWIATIHSGSDQTRQLSITSKHP